MALLAGVLAAMASVHMHDGAAAAVSVPGGLTLARFNNTALAGAPSAVATIPELESIATCSSPAAPCSVPSSLLLTGRLSPPTAGRYGFELTFDPPLPYPSEQAYAR